MSEPRIRRMAICINPKCPTPGELKQISAHGLCEACYKRQQRQDEMWVNSSDPDMIAYATRVTDKRIRKNLDRAQAMAHKILMYVTEISEYRLLNPSGVELLSNSDAGVIKNRMQSIVDEYRRVTALEARLEVVCDFPSGQINTRMVATTRPTESATDVTADAKKMTDVIVDNTVAQPKPDAPTPVTPVTPDTPITDDDLPDVLRPTDAADANFVARAKNGESTFPKKRNRKRTK